MTDHTIYSESREIQTLYRPQAEQLGMELHHRSGGLEGQVDGDICQGRFQANPAGPYCLVIWHDITFLREMDFSEYAMTDYACLTLDESPASNPAPYRLQPCTMQEANMASLVQRAGSVTNRMPAGSRSRTRSICILPDYFMELENQWPGQVKGLFDAFCQPWPSDIAQAALTALSNCAPGRQGQTEFLVKAHIDLLLARLAQSSSALVQSHEPSYDCDLVQQAKTHIQSHLGGDLSIDQIAQSLYVGRTRLCTAFRQQTVQVWPGISESKEWSGPAIFFRPLRRTLPGLAGRSDIRALVHSALLSPEKPGLHQALGASTATVSIRLAPIEASVVAKVRQLEQLPPIDPCRV